MFMSIKSFSAFDIEAKEKSLNGKENITDLLSLVDEVPPAVGKVKKLLSEKIEEAAEYFSAR